MKTFSYIGFRFIVAVASMLFAALSCSGAPKSYKLKVVKEYPHSTESYTQGLFFTSDGVLYESTGQHGKSKLMKVDLTTGKALQSVSFNRKYFGEGSVILNGKIYMLTWQSRVVFVYDAATLKYEKTLAWPYEGWGLTTDGKNLIVSTGSSKLYYVDPASFKVLRTVDVKVGDRPIRYLNELEMIDGKIWANVYLSDVILIINPSSGAVEGVIDCTGLLPSSLKTAETDVLNGIARNPVDGKIYLTGKNWPRLYEITLVKE